MNLLTLIKYRKGWFRKAKFKWFRQNVDSFCVECTSDIYFGRLEYDSCNFLYTYKSAPGFDKHRLYKRVYKNNMNPAAAFFFVRRIANNDPNALFWWR